MAQLAGSVAEMSAYHHGEVSGPETGRTVARQNPFLSTTLISHFSNALDFVVSNFLALLYCNFIHGSQSTVNLATGFDNCKVIAASIVTSLSVSTLSGRCLS